MLRSFICGHRNSEAAMYQEDDFLNLSGIQHYCFCRRQWGLIHIEMAWQENLLTTEGHIMHERAHNETLRERRGDTIIVRGLTVHSDTLGIVGQCDVVEFHKSSSGHPLYKENGYWSELPIEYKHGKSKLLNEDRLQLCAQAMCLEEMFGSSIPYACLYYGKTKSRERVELSESLRNEVRTDFVEMHDLYARHRIPKTKYFSGCKSCSLKDLCLPKVKSVEAYIESSLQGVI